MIDNTQSPQWDKAARVALMRHLGKDDQIAHLASIVLALLGDREDRERWIQERT